MTLDQLEMIEAIVAEGSMQKAAIRLHKSQPSLSVGLKKVEERYGLQIFSRETYRPKLTPQGEAFYKGVQAVLNSYRRLHKVATELGAETEPELCIVLDPIVSISRISPLLERAAKYTETTQVTIGEEVLEGPLNELRGGRADFAVGHCPPHRTHEVEKISLCVLELIPVVKRGLNYRKLPNVIVGESSSTITPHEISKPIWKACSHARKEELILAGLGWGRMSKAKVKEYGAELSAIRSPDILKIDLEIFLMRDKLRPLKRVGKALWESII
jgi:DNA-binding transcriptional LysR family regulator